MEANKNIFRVKLFIIATFAAILSSVLLYAKQRSDKVNDQLAQWRDISVEIPDTIPTMDQESIETALAMFGIEVPKNAEPPLFSEKLLDRGLTIRKGWAQKANVHIGPSAFTSWALLGSTLAHEYEVHCRQNFLIIMVKDMFKFNGTYDAEREAYLYEIKNAKRFSLSDTDIQLITDTMNYYYPDDQRSQIKTAGANIGKKITNWLAR